MSSSLSPTTRSRTSLFLSFRESRARSTRFARPRARPRYTDLDDADDEHEGLIGAGAHVAVDVNEPPPPWVDLSDQVEDLLEDAKSKIASLEKLHSKHILPGFSDRSHEEREIEALTTNITKDFRRCHFLVQKIGSYQPHSFPPDPQSSKHQLHTAKNVQRGLAAKLQDLSATFRKKQRVYMEKLQGQATKNQDLLVASGATHTRNQSMSLVHADPSVELRARDRELTEIANSIATLAELFKDLSALVIDQGTLLDSVEYNVEQTAVHLEGAVEELKVATKYQKNTGRRKCIFLLLLIIFGLIVVLIFKPKRHRSSTPPPPSSSPIASISLPPQARSETDAAASRVRLQHPWPRQRAFG
ncbi:t-SNARE [Coprinellus micaceus]|uniref:t-SNARE n=1 Tax=Coprinellus micaceus TaxID=71717 RepID=A0A4Y7TWM1_COPMI|nr:t-SNARE [Coprinellus micaceus]